MKAWDVLYGILALLTAVLACATAWSMWWAVLYL